MQAYRIVDWQEHYENNRTRDMKNMQWVPVPIKHDGYGYGLLVSKNGAARLGAWLAILQTAAKSHPRGTLMRDGRHPHTAATISVKTRLPKDIIQETITECMKPDIGWLEIVDVQGDKCLPAEIPHPPEEIPQEPARKGREGNGTEGNRKEGDYSPTGKPAEPRPRTFKQWTEDEFIDDCNKANAPGILNDKEGNAFARYWSEPGASGRMRFQYERTWDTGRRMITWRERAMKGK